MLIYFIDIFHLIVCYVIGSLTMLQFYVYITLYQHCLIRNVAITLYEDVDVDINVVQHSLC